MGTQLNTNRDTNDETLVLDGIEGLPLLAVPLLPANPDRIKIIISVLDEDGFVRLMDSTTQPLIHKGIFVPEGGTITIDGAMHTGPVSGIVAKVNKEPTFYVTEI